MRWFDQLVMKVRMVFKRGKAGAELDDEMRFHLDRQIAENIAAGMTLDEARTAALRTFGNPALLRDRREVLASQPAGGRTRRRWRDADERDG